MTMNGEREPGTGQPSAADERELAELLRGAGPRLSLPQEDLDAIEDAVRAAWRARYARRDVRHRTGWAALAAAAVLAMAIGLVWRAGRPEPWAPVAHVERFAGEVRLDAGAERGDPVAANHRITAGSWLETAAGPEGTVWVALRLAGGASLRLDRESRVRLLAADRVELERGAVYVDSGAGGAAPVEVLTRWASFAELGTQYEVRLVAAGSGEAARLRVREGRVALAAAGARAVAAAGEELRVGPGGVVARAGIARSGPDWSWVLAAAPRFDLEGRTVRDFLDWYARETGSKIELADVATRESVERTRLHGSIAHLGVEETPAVVLPSAGLAAERDGDRLRVTTVSPGN